MSEHGLERGAAQIVGDHIWNTRKCRVKFGIDPTAASVHLGHAVVLRKLRGFQIAGHDIHLIIGTATACVGDPSGRDKARQGIDLDTAHRNANTYLNQIGKVIDLDRVQVHYNHQWFNKFGHREWMALLGHVTAQQILNRDDFAKRMDSGSPICMTEMIYPLMQAWDSYAVSADVEIGGTEQLFNLQLGRHIQKQYGQREQTVMTLPLLRGLDGKQKMGKSLGNYIGLDEMPFDIYSKVMSIPDDLMPEWYTLLTDEQPEGTPFDQKKMLAWRITDLVHSFDAANDAEERWVRQFSQRADPLQMPEIVVPKGEHRIVDLIVKAGFASTLNEARRLISPVSCVSLGERTGMIVDPRATAVPYDGMVLRAGNRRVCKIRTQL